MDLKHNHLAHVRYIKQTDFGGGRKGEVTERVILPTYIPGDTIKALDLTDLSESEALKLQEQAKEYAQYVEAKMTTVFSFEDWRTHTQGVGTFPELKYRTFKVGSLEVIKSE